MNRFAAGNAIQFALTAMGGSLMRLDQAVEGHKPSPRLSSSTPVTSGHRSERVLSLLLALEALRAAPEVLDRARGRS